MQAFQPDRIDLPGPGELGQHQVATLAGRLWMAARIISARRLDHTSQQCQRRCGQFVKRAAEVMLARQRKAMNRPVARLAQKNLVDIGFEDLRFAIMPFQQ